MNIIDKIITYNKLKTKAIDKILNKKHKYIINFDIKNNNKLISFISNNKKIISGTYNIYGIYQKSTKLFLWATIIPNSSKTIIQKVDKIKSFNYLFEKLDDKKSVFYYQLLTQDTILIKDFQMLDWINQLLIYLSDDVYYFNPLNEDNDIEFITLQTIKEKFV
jgi:hypothetical protein